MEGCQNYKISRGPTKDRTVDQLFGRLSQKSVTSRVTKSDVLDKVLNFFISGNIAFNQADNYYFEELISLIKINDEAVKVNRDNITKRLHHHASDARDDLMARLMSNDSKISISMNCWTSNNNIAFLGNVFL